PIDTALVPGEPRTIATVQSHARVRLKSRRFRHLLDRAQLAARSDPAQIYVIVARAIAVPGHVDIASPVDSKVGRPGAGSTHILRRRPPGRAESGMRDERFSALVSDPYQMQIALAVRGEAMMSIGAGARRDSR